MFPESLNHKMDIPDWILAFTSSRLKQLKLYNLWTMRKCVGVSCPDCFVHLTVLVWPIKLQNWRLRLIRQLEIKPYFHYVLQYEQTRVRLEVSYRKFWYEIYWIRLVKAQTDSYHLDSTHIYLHLASDCELSCCFRLIAQTWGLQL